MKKIISIIMAVLLLSITVLAEEDADEILESYSEMYGGIFEKGIDEANAYLSFNELIPNTKPKEMLKNIMNGELDVSVQELFKIIVKGLLGEVYNSLHLLGLVVALAVLCAYLMGLQEGFGKEGVQKSAFFVCYITIAIISSTAFYDGAKLAGQAIENISSFMKIIVPVVIATLVASGAPISASVFEPVLIATVEIGVAIVQGVFIPLVMVTTALNVVNNLSDRFKTDRMVKFITQLVKWGLSIMLTIFVSVAGLQSIAASGADGITIKLTKFAASNLIPVVGGILSESVETVMSCSALIKNSVGIMGIIVMGVIAITPLLKIAGILLIFRLAAAISEPVSEPKIIKCISELANSISLLFSMLAATTVMFIVVLTIMINAGNVVVMMGR